MAYQHIPLMFWGGVFTTSAVVIKPLFEATLWHFWQQMRWSQALDTTFSQTPLFLMCSFLSTVLLWLTIFKLPLNLSLSTTYIIVGCGLMLANTVAYLWLDEFQKDYKTLILISFSGASLVIALPLAIFFLLVYL